MRRTGGPLAKLAVGEAYQNTQVPAIICQVCNKAFTEGFILRWGFLLLQNSGQLQCLPSGVRHTDVCAPHIPCRTLHGVDIDHADQEIFMPLEEGTAAGAPGVADALLLVDYDKDDVGEWHTERAERQGLSASGPPITGSARCQAP